MKRTLFGTVIVLCLALYGGSVSFATIDAAPASQPTAVATSTEDSLKKAEPTKSVPTTEVRKTEATTSSSSQEVQKWWQGLLVIIIQAVAAIVTPVLGVLLMILVRKWQLKIEQDKVEWIVSKAVGFGEQKAKQALNAGKPMEGPEIAKVAVEQGGKLLQQYKLPKKLGDYLADLVEAKLGEKLLDQGGRAGQSGANPGSSRG